MSIPPPSSTAASHPLSPLHPRAPLALSPLTQAVFYHVGASPRAPAERAMQAACFSLLLLFFSLSSPLYFQASFLLKFAFLPFSFLFFFLFLSAD